MSEETSQLTGELWFKLNATRSILKALANCETSDFHQGLTDAASDAIESAFTILQGLESQLHSLTHTPPNPQTEG